MGNKKLAKIKNRLKELGRVGIAFSGGVDSTLLLKLACDELGSENVLALTAKTAFYSQREVRQSREMAKSLNVPHIFIPIDPLTSPQIIENSPRRCYYCKRTVMAVLKEEAEKRDYNHLLDGANADDLKDFRPGQQGARELGIISPLEEGALTKGEIRSISKKMGLSTWDKPAMACLASRIPYGVPITKNRLEQIEKGEELLFSLGFRQVRLRHHGEIARLEVDEDSLSLLVAKRIPILKKFRRLGFKYITLDLAGYRMGSLKDILEDEECK